MQVVYQLEGCARLLIFGISVPLEASRELCLRSRIIPYRTPKPRKDIFVHPYSTSLLVTFILVLDPRWYYVLHCEPRPVSHASLAFDLSP
jgi:hypothetical protein